MEILWVHHLSLTFRKLVKSSLLLFSGLTVLVILHWPQGAEASLFTIRNPRTFFLNYSSLSVKAMAFSCLALDAIPDDLPCQPALLQLERKSRFVASGSISNGFQSLTKARRILSNDLDAAFLNDLFTKDQIIEVETNPAMLFASRYLSAKYLLYGLQFYSTQRNQSNPELELFASESKQLIVQSSYPLSSHVFVGLQLRSQQDKVVQKSFRLVDLGTDNGKELLKPAEYSRVFAEPGAIVLWNGFKFSVFGANLAVASNDSAGLLPERPEAQWGSSYQMPLYSGSLDLTLDYKSLSYTESNDQKLHSGLRYRYGALSLLAGADSWGLSSGILFSIEKLYAGILYSTSQLPWRRAEEYAQTTYIEIGWQL